MKAAHIGVAVGGISIAFSALCFVVTPAFTAAFILAVVFGVVSGAIALALKATRTAIVAFVFAVTPFCGFLLIEYAAEPLRNGYVVFVPLVLATGAGVLALISYLRARHLMAGASV